MENLTTLHEFELIIGGQTYRFRASVTPDTDMGPPWEEHDGHGEISAFTTRNKCPGELVLNDRCGAKRFYDYQATVQKALREGWNASPYYLDEFIIKGPIQDGERLFWNNEDGWVGRSSATVFTEAETKTLSLPLEALGYVPYETPRMRASRAALADFKRMYGWCHDEWGWCGLVVDYLDEDGEPVEGIQASVWGLEDDDRDYLIEEAKRVAEDELVSLVDNAQLPQLPEAGRGLEVP